MTRDAVQVRPVEAGDAPALVELFEACFDTRLSAEYFAWKYYRNPAGEAIGFVADTGERLAAFYGVIPEPWIVGGGDATVWQSMDTMTHPEFQRRGLFVRLAECTYEEVRHRTERCDLVGIPGPTSLPGFVGRLGWAKVHEFDILAVPAFIVRAWPERGDRRVKVELIGRPDTRIHSVLEAASKPEAPSWPRLDGKFFDWRVFGHSPKRFRVALASLGDRPIALCVYTGNSPRATQISYLAARDDETQGWLPPLLRFVARQGLMLYTWRPQRRRLAASYRSMGFRANPLLLQRSLPRRVPLIARSDTGFVNGVTWDDPHSYDLQPLMQD